MVTFLIATAFHPVFAGFILLDILNRIALGRQIIRSIRETWFSLLIATGLLIVFNYVYAIYIFIAYTDDIGYGEICTSLYRCLLLLLDQSLKSGSGFLGTVSTDYTYMTLNMKFLSEIAYILFAQKVIFEIFSGTIIDKFS
jgi:hypothetical protein